jgi:hypothetical protein
MTINEMDTTSLQGLMESAIAATPVTSVARKAAHKKAIKEFDIDHLLAMQDQMADAINQMTACTFITEDRPELSEAQLELVMRALDQQKNIKDLLEVWYQEARDAIFRTITTNLTKNGVEDAEFAPGEAPILAMGKKFVREGGKAKLTLDHEKLAEGFGIERWNKIHTTEIIPERTETKVDEDKLIQMVANEPALLDVFKTAVRVDGRTPIRLNIRKLDADE